MPHVCCRSDAVELSQNQHVACSNSPGQLSLRLRRGLLGCLVCYWPLGQVIYCEQSIGYATRPTGATIDRRFVLQGPATKS